MVFRETLLYSVILFLGAGFLAIAILLEAGLKWMLTFFIPELHVPDGFFVFILSAFYTADIILFIL